MLPSRRSDGTSTTLALEVGFDGVELHGGSGCLIDQFLNTASSTFYTPGEKGCTDYPLEL